MRAEPLIALAFTPDAWVEELHRFLTDHGGARVGTLVVDPALLAHEEFVVLVADANWSALSAGLVASLHERGRRVLGVADDAHAAAHLRRCGVDGVVAAGAAPRSFVAAIVELAERGDDPGPFDAPVVPVGAARVVVVAGPAGSGTTEVACALASSAGAVLVDADEVAPSVAARLGLALEPNVRTLVDAVEHDTGDPEAALQLIGRLGAAAVPGVANVATWSHVRAPEVVRAVRALSAARDVVVDTSAPLDDVGPASRGRYAVTRAMVVDADELVVVGTATPLGVVRLLGWLADLCAVRNEPAVHVVLNRSAVAARELDVLVDELLDAFEPVSLWCCPEDPRVRHAGWLGTVVADGPFVRAVQDLARHLELSVQPSTRRRRRWAS